MRRHRSERDKETAEERHASPPEPSQDSLLALVQRGAGNASISRMLARQVTPEAERESQGGTAVAPHEPGDNSADLLALAGSAGGLAGAFGGRQDAPVVADSGPTRSTWLEAETTVAQPAGGQQAKPAVPKEIADWFGEHPTTNATIADWLLRGKGYGFLKFTSGPLYERQIRDISQRRTKVTILTTLGGQTDTLPINPDGQLGVLVILESLVRGNAGRWTADPAQKKVAVEAGDLLRNLQGLKIADAHAGPSADLFQGFDWNGAKGPDQVLQALGDLPAGNYKIGLPFQGQFFPLERYLATRQDAAKRAAGKDGTPAPISTPSMIRFSNDLYTSTWNPNKQTQGGGVGGYDDTPTGKQHGGVAELRSASLRQGIAGLGSKGINITVAFADNNNHIHITRE